MDPVQARARFATARVARLATVRPDGRPHIVPLVFALTDDDIVWSAVDAKPKRTLALARLHHVAARPAVSLLVDHYAEDWATLWWVRADGEAEVIDVEDPRAAEAHARLRARYPQSRPVGAVLAVRVTRFRGWSAAAPPRLR